MNILLAVVLSATIQVDAPRGAVIELDGKPFSGGEVEDGPHVLVVWRRGYWDDVRTIDAKGKMKVKVRLKRGISSRGKLVTSPFVQTCWREGPGYVEADIKETQIHTWSVSGFLKGGLPEYYLLRCWVSWTVENRGARIFGFDMDDFVGEREVIVLGHDNMFWNGLGKRVENAHSPALVSIIGKPFKDGKIRIRGLSITALKRADFVKLGLLKEEK